MGNFIVRRYEDINGNDPIEEFILKSTKIQRAKIFRQTEHLEEYGISPRNPALKKVSGTNIWEMRSLGKDNIRIFCAPYNKGIVLLHIIIKKSQKTSQKDLSIALKRYSELID